MLVMFLGVSLGTIRVNSPHAKQARPLLEADLYIYKKENSSPNCQPECKCSLCSGLGTHVAGCAVNRVVCHNPALKHKGKGRQRPPWSPACRAVTADSGEGCTRQKLELEFVALSERNSKVRHDGDIACVQTVQC